MRPLYCLLALCVALVAGTSAKAGYGHCASAVFLTPSYVQPPVVISQQVPYAAPTYAAPVVAPVYAAPVIVTTPLFVNPYPVFSTFNYGYGHGFNSFRNFRTFNHSHGGFRTFRR